MDKKKILHHPSSSSDETESGGGDEHEHEEGFLRRDRSQQKSADEAARSWLQESESEDDSTDQDHLDKDKTISLEDNADSDSETTSSSDGKPSIPHLQAVEYSDASRGKRTPPAEVLVKPKLKTEVSTRKPQEKASKRAREEQSTPEKITSTKLKDETSEFPAKAIQDVPRAKHFAKANRVQVPLLEKSSNPKNSALASVEKSEDASTPQISPKKRKRTLSKKADDEGKNVKKSKNEDTKPAKDSFSPGKTKLFTGKDEIVLTTEVLHDMQKGVDVPSKKTDEYWSKLAERVGQRMEESRSKEQLCDKLKRMRQRYIVMAEKFKNSQQHKFRNTIDEELYGMWDQMWGNGDAAKLDAEDVKNKTSQAGATSRQKKTGKRSSNKASAPMQDVKVMKGEPQACKSDSVPSQSEESNDGNESLNEHFCVRPMDIDLKDACADGNLMSHLINKLHHVLRKEIHATLAEVQKSSKQTLKEWQSKALTVVEMALKAFADQARPLNAKDMGVLDGSCIPLRHLDLSDCQLYEGDYTLQQNWHELRLKELEIYRQRLELVQRECQLKEERLKALLQKKK